MTNSSELEIGEPTSNSIQVLYIQLRKGDHEFKRHDCLSVSYPPLSTQLDTA